MRLLLMLVTATGALGTAAATASTTAAVARATAAATASTTAAATVIVTTTAVTATVAAATAAACAAAVWPFGAERAAARQDLPGAIRGRIGARTGKTDTGSDCWNHVCCCVASSSVCRVRQAPWSASSTW